jgi:hypothetical protein
MVNTHCCVWQQEEYRPGSVSHPFRQAFLAWKWRRVKVPVWCGVTDAFAHRGCFASLLPALDCLQADSGPGETSVARLPGFLGPLVTIWSIDS